MVSTLSETPREAGKYVPLIRLRLQILNTDITYVIIDLNLNFFSYLREAERFPVGNILIFSGIAGKWSDLDVVLIPEIRSQDYNKIVF